MSAESEEAEVAGRHARDKDAADLSFLLNGAIFIPSGDPRNSLTLSLAMMLMLVAIMSFVRADDPEEDLEG
eukprot:CAMPEP_0198240322 /NCGR_PEP_ID=MMETSP1446-20131203/5478_1 /TAXON_ID=1461542 ORGANISM="Unidentified sp, Strain CCMP2111" /NCGR_SAMPLE_ID=MMETSP1446 /ASSEMBLY_ACC=CAM_ASM_001112 /LENGTH=70 /DNA_ID=CAMNT_0043923041 /DNA_START=9 /DNA_END=218 /DNA_ORIENTATION=-